MPTPLEKRKKTKVVTKPAQLNNLGILTPEQDPEGNKLRIQPTVIQRPNALQMRAFQQGGVGMQMPTAGLANMAIQGNQAPANVTPSGMSNASIPAEQRKNAKNKMMV